MLTGQSGTSGSVPHGWVTFEEATRAKAELKAKLCRTLTGFQSVVYGSDGESSVGLCGIGLGVGRNREGRYILTVRVMNRWLRNSPTLDAALAEFSGFVDRRYIGRVTASADWRSYWWRRNPYLVRPLRPGVGLSHHKSRGVGSAGFFVEEPGFPKETAVFSNAHVLNAPENLSRGSHAGPSGRDQTIQPSGYHHGRIPQHQIGELVCATPIRRGVRNTIDAGYTRLDPAHVVPGLNLLSGPGLPAALTRIAKSRINGFNLNPQDFVQTAAEDEELDPSFFVYKDGCMTGWRKGVLSSAAVDQPFYFPGVGTVDFENVLEIEGYDGNRPKVFANQGDSGSAVLDARGHVLGLIFAVSVSGARRWTRNGQSLQLAFAIPSAAILDAFPNLRLV